ncbi:prolyl oligopeptidase family serine peptidase [Candidatus Kryptobacter tengchongensis]|uniref:Dipeptidyl aminopeptidase/acylaminoacyl peptidase n=1 Tax=Kryptobacter tengchongensis TaxID=1643429 RepID=A0A916LJ41_KRYT1|nr:S9 family peptidase [Candidatus Kryptobacter tengchongensis]CUS99664.1 Dipeptidyl aminopeptidase/acylaminoacyl peptidase [Candidatus Kryptobacter tengchongensis]
MIRKFFNAFVFTILPLFILLAQTYTIEQYLNIRSASNPTISPDGKFIAYLTDVTGTNQVWKKGLTSGCPEQLTFFDERVQFISWNPKDKYWILFGKDVGGNEHTQLFLLKSDGSEIRRLTYKDDVIYNFGAWSNDGVMFAFTSNERNRAFFDVYSMNIKTGQTKLVWQNDGNNSVVAWSPDNRYIVVSQNRSSFDNDLYVIEYETGKVYNITPHSQPARYFSVKFSKDGKRIYLLSDEGKEFVGIAYIELPNGKLNYIFNTNWDVETFEISKDGKYLVFVLNVDGYSEVYSLNIATKRTKKLNFPAGGIVRSLRFTPDGSKIIFTYQSPVKNQDIYYYDVKSNTCVQITQSSTAGIPQSSFVEPKLVRFKSFDGLEIPGYLYLPKNAKKDSSLAVIVSIHGGPEAQELPRFSALYQYFVNNGYVIYAPNIRGSTGYGKTYASLDNTTKRKDAIKDVAMIPEFLKSTGYINPKKIIVYGGSYGGYMTLAAVTFYPELWAAGVDLVGISNFLTFLKNTGAWRQRHRMAEYGDPEKDAEFLKEISPFYHVDRIKAPLMIIQGANDPRVPKSESDQIVESLKARGAIVEYLVFDDEGHGISKLKNRIKAYKAIVEFLDKNVKNK